MIEQQINLYQDRFRERRLWASAHQVASALALMVVGIAIGSYLLSAELNQTEYQSLLIKTERERLSADLATVNAELAKLLKDNKIDLKIENTARQISARKKVLNFVDANRFGSGEGFSAYLVALSKLHADNIWLNQIHLTEDFVGIKGSSLRAEQVPGYFDRFSEQEIFRGSRFDLFKLSRADDSDWKVDFEIATSGDFDE